MDAAVAQRVLGKLVSRAASLHLKTSYLNPYKFQADWNLLSLPRTLIHSYRKDFGRSDQYCHLR